MLSRLSLRSVKNFGIWPLYPSCAVNSIRCSTTATSSDSGSAKAIANSNDSVLYAKSGTKFPWEGPERDVVNFPRPVQLVEPGKTRFLFVPEEWFQFFYNKTGVTGPYVLTFGMFNYLMSKELWIIDHEYYYVYATVLIFYFANKKFGSTIANLLDKEVAKDDDQLKAIRNDGIKDLEEAIADEKKLQWQSEGQKLLVDAKRENVAMQQEAVYRERAMQVYTEVKKRLEFHSQKQMMERRVSQKHMCNWIVQQVVKSITAQQEKDMLKKCLVDLQALSAKA